MAKQALAAVAAMAMTLAACGESEAPTPKAAEVPAKLPAGLYDVASEVTVLASTDKSTPATRAKVGDKATMKACVAADGTPDMAMFVDAGDSCNPTTSYARSGRISVQYQCSRTGKGNLYPAADGVYTADGFEAVVNLSTSFSGTGDYRQTRKITATRSGDCPAGGAPKA